MPYRNFVCKKMLEEKITKNVLQENLLNQFWKAKEII